MQGITYGRSVHEIVQRLRLPDLLQVLGGFLTSDTNIAITTEQKTAFSQIFWDVEIGLASLSTNSDTLAVMQTFDLDRFFSRAIRTELLTSFQQAGTSSTVLTNRNFWRLFYAAEALVQLDSAYRELVLEPKLHPATEDMAIFEFEVDDYGGEPLSVPRLAEILRSITQLFALMAEVVGVEAAEPSVAYTDSGTKVTFGLEGASDVVDAIRRAFGDAWRAIRFPKNEKLEQDLASVESFLRVNSELQARVDAGDLDRETAARLCHGITEQVVTLVGVGVMSTDVSESDDYDRHQVLSAVRERKLLPPPEPASKDGAGESSGQDG